MNADGRVGNICEDNVAILSVHLSSHSGIGIGTGLFHIFRYQNR